mmetsp:Transcript_23092/g.32983  ORF Transcript_23092/g.32983 Transcript_23092/m.32983 type:complete len:100 (-) Transcript_23092:378-677(-)
MYEFCPYPIVFRCSVSPLFSSIVASANCPHHLSNPLIITTTTNKNQRQRIIPNITCITLKKHCFIMSTFATMCLLTPRECRIIPDCGWDGVEDVADFFF